MLYRVTQPAPMAAQYPLLSGCTTPGLVPLDRRSERGCLAPLAQERRAAVSECRPHGWPSPYNASAL